MSAFIESRIAFFQRIWKKLLIISVALIATAMVIEQNVRIGWDGQSRSCLPWAFYYYHPIDDVEVPTRGQLVRVNLPKKGPGHLQKDLRERFEKGVPGGGAKLVVGLPGDRVVIKDNWIFVNEEPWGYLWLLPHLKLEPNALDTEYTIPEGRYLVMGTQAESYDGRYWGTIPQKDILGSLRVIL